MSKRAQRSRSDRRAAATSQRRDPAKEAGSPRSTASAGARPRQQKGLSLSAMRRNPTAILAGSVVIMMIIVVLIWLVARQGGALSPSAATTTPEGATGMKQWANPPAMQIDPQKTYFATIKTDKGDIRVQLFADKVPNTVNSFVFLAREGFYDNTTFHRVIEGFMAQGGDPTGTGRGGPGYRFADEFDPSLKHDSEGILSMANAGANTNGSQFFITYAPQPHLDGAHAVFGKVVSGMDVARSLQVRSPDDPNAPPASKIVTIEIEEQ